jgi:hypothetical protein
MRTYPLTNCPANIGRWEFRNMCAVSLKKAYEITLLSVCPFVSLHPSVFVRLSMYPRYLWGDLCDHLAVCISFRVFSSICVFLSCLCITPIFRRLMRSPCCLYILSCLLIHLCLSVCLCIAPIFRRLMISPCCLYVSCLPLIFFSMRALLYQRNVGQ